MIGNMGILSSYKGPLGLMRGWGPTLVGYSFQGLGKFGLNDFFKYKYKGFLGDEFCSTYPRVYYAMCSGSAEFFADILLCPWETVKLKVQTVDINNWLEGKSKGYANGLMDGFPKVMSEEGFGGLYKIIGPLWARQIPYTIIKFVAFEDFIRRIYGFTEVQYKLTKEDFNKTQQLGFTFAAGYGAGIFCGAVSHPADTMASLMAKNPGESPAKLYKSNGGFGGLWGGFGARVFMIGTLTGLQWFIYDTTKVAFGLPSGGGKK
eukprot:gb/GEZN01009959.1/.p1 GENE.gb/GEZN01009959.1/~~gb/GEZN01009959.1/.p1  ORF type:complete len:262 (-),score=41.28 gb/GEZN01009959.1/:201-986(-)